MVCKDSAKGNNVKCSRHYPKIDDKVEKKPEVVNNNPNTKVQQVKWPLPLPEIGVKGGKPVSSEGIIIERGDFFDRDRIGRGWGRGDRWDRGRWDRDRWDRDRWDRDRWDRDRWDRNRWDRGRWDRDRDRDKDRDRGRDMNYGRAGDRGNQNTYQEVNYNSINNDNNFVKNRMSLFNRKTIDDVNKNMKQQKGNQHY